MKPLELTEEHKSKLLEMCRILFPEYTTIQFGNQSNYYLESEEILDFYNDKENFSIHWFEFCMTHLTTKLYNISHLKDESSIKQLRGYICQDVDHPVDYLYGEFKKLKL